MVKPARGLETRHILGSFSPASNLEGGIKLEAFSKDSGRFWGFGVRRRRRRSGFSKPTPHRKWILAGVACVAVVGGMLFFMHQAEILAPPAHDVRVELPLK